MPSEPRNNNESDIDANEPNNDNEANVDAEHGDVHKGVTHVDAMRSNIRNF